MTGQIKWLINWLIDWLIDWLVAAIEWLKICIWEFERNVKKIALKLFSVFVTCEWIWSKMMMIRQ